MVDKKWIAPDSEGYALYSLPRFLKDQKRSGYRFVSLWGGSPHIFVDCYGYEDPADIKNQLRETGISPVCYRPQSYGYTLCAPKGSLLWNSSLDYYRFSAELASKLTAPLAVLEIGGVIRDQDRGRQNEAASDGIRLVSQECKNQGIRLAVIAGTAESGALLNSSEAVERFLEMVGDESVKAALDVAAARQRKESVEDWFRVFGTDLCHIRTGGDAKALFQENEVPGYQGYYGCSSNPAAVSAGGREGIDNPLEKGGGEDGWKQ